MELSTNIIKPFNTNSTHLSAEWDKWKLSLEVCLKAYECDDPQTKVNWLLHLGGPDVVELFSTISDPDYNEEEDVFKKALIKLDSYFTPKKQKRFERHVFRKIKQSENEKFEMFVFKLRQQAKYCDYGTFLEDALIDQIIEGCNSKKLKDKCLTEDLGLNKIIQLGTSLENVDRQLKSLCNDIPVATVNVNQISKQQPRKFNNMNNECFQCGRR
jgi:hypothetical protein